MQSKCPCGKHEFNPMKQFCYWVIDEIKTFDQNKDGKPTGKVGGQEVHQHPEVICMQEEKDE